MQVKLLAFIPSHRTPGEFCPCGSGRYYKACCLPEIRSGRWNHMMAAYNRLFPTRHGRAFYIYTPSKGDIRHDPQTS